MTTKPHLSRMTLDIPQEDHRRLKALSALLDKSMKDLVVEWIQEHLYSSNMPNAETLKAIEQIEKGENLVHCKTTKKMFENLGI
ncbi:MAG: hypothetical protein ACRDAI_03285 [Candidatus Rhabdochlamydia sp.]